MNCEELQQSVDAIRMLLPDFKELVDSMRGKYDPMLVYAIHTMYDLIRESVEEST